MLINNWYVAACAHEVQQGKPLGVKMLGMDFVLFRDAQGSAVCLSGVCCHRGGVLSDGLINDGCVACPYHGWEFAGDGACVKIPALGEGAKIPKRGRVDSYPVQEKYGWVWTFLGDLPEEKRPAIPDLFPEYDDTQNWRRMPFQFEAKCNWMRMEENSLDTAHTNFVHRAFGARHAPALEASLIEETEWGARVARTKPAPKTEQKSGDMAHLLQKGRKNTSVNLEFSVIGVCHRINPTFRPGMSLITFTARTPIDAYRTRAIGWQARNYLMAPEHDAERMALIDEAVREDLSVVEKVQPPLTPKSLSHEFLTETDGMEVAFRKAVWRAASQGWEIDRQAFEQERLTRVLVIPSPARRADPKNWIHKSVPLIAPHVDAASRSAAE